MPPELVFPPDHPFASKTILGSPTEELPGPQAFLVEAPDHSRTGAHFHPVDQFQVFFPSEGTWYQREELGSVTVHYADAYATYGPFGSGEGGFDFYTLRARSTIVNAFMPGSRDKLVRKGRRNLHVELGNLLGHQLAAGAHETHAVFAPEADGLAAYLLAGGPDAVVVAPESVARGGEGTYFCVLTGSVVGDGADHGARALAWRGPGVTPDVLHAGDAGFEVLVLQFPGAS